MRYDFCVPRCHHYALLGYQFEHQQDLLKLSLMKTFSSQPQDLGITDILFFCLTRLSIVESYVGPHFFTARFLNS